MYAWYKNKFPYDLFSKWLYTLVKSLKLQKSCIETVVLDIHMEIFTDAQMVTWEKVIILVTSINNSEFVLDYVNCQASRGILNFLLWVT